MKRNVIEEILWWIKFVVATVGILDCANFPIFNKIPLSGVQWIALYILFSIAEEHFRERFLRIGIKNKSSLEE